MKKLFLGLLVLVMVSGVVFGQTSEPAKNNLSLHFGIIGAELSYERMLSKHFSVLGDVSYTNMIFMDEFTASVKGRAYPFGGAFYLDLGFGYSYGRGVVNAVTDMVLTLFTFGWYLSTIDIENGLPKSGGALIQGGLGWKIDIGKEDAFVLPVSAGVDIKLGAEIPDFLPYLRVGAGYSF